MHADTVPCLLKLAEEFDILGPKRDHASDGSIGDTAHQSRSSNHNRDDVSGSKTPQTDSDSSPDIRAIDVDDSGPWLNGFTMQKGVDHIVSRCRSGAEKRLVEIIYDRHAWYASNGWNRVDYTGSNPHTEHAHFGAKADTGKLENDRSPWGLVEKWGDVALTNTDVDKILDYDDVPNPYTDAATNPNITVRSALKAAAMADATTRDIAAGLAALRQDFAAYAAKDPTDEQAIINGVLAGLAGAEGAADTIADAVVAALPADLATDVANQILAKQGQAMVDAAGGEDGS